jgi:pyroglutamyl-peptidase
MRILVTAFGPFEGRSENASSLALLKLKTSLPEIRTRILPVDSVVAPARLREALRLIRPEILVLLGEAAGSKTIRLETTAFNELDFRIPDISGRQPTARPIRRDAPAIRHSTLPFKQVHHLLSASDHPIVLSHDPGRYLCNQVLYTALEYLERHALPCRAGFIHLPLSTDYPTDFAADTVSRIIRSF